MKRRLGYYIVMLNSILLLLGACKRDDAPVPCNDPSNRDCINYDPCYGVQPVTADFEMWYYDHFLNPNGNKLEDALIAEDSIFPPGEIYFRAKLHNAQYTWKLGAETIHDSGDYRLFGGSQFNPEYGLYYNSLTVTKQPNYSCFPNDTSWAKVTRSIRIVRPSELLTSGMFKVLYDGYTDSVILQILTWNSTVFPFKDTSSVTDRLLIGFPETISDSTYVDVFGGYYLNRALVFNEFIAAYPYNGSFKVDPVTWKVESEYYINTGFPGPFTIKKFSCKGRKIK